MASYKVSGATAIGATKTALSILAAATVRPRLTSFCVSTDGVPGTDAGVEFGLKRFSADGSGGSTPTPVAGDPADPAARTVARSGHTAEPTYTSTIFDRAINPRLTHVWMAENQEAEIVVPAVAGAGLGLQCIVVGGGVGNFRADMSFRE